MTSPAEGLAEAEAWARHVAEGRWTSISSTVRHLPRIVAEYDRRAEFVQILADQVRSWSEQSRRLQDQVAAVRALAEAAAATPPPALRWIGWSVVSDARGSNFGTVQDREGAERIAEWNRATYSDLRVEETYVQDPADTRIEAADVLAVLDSSPEGPLVSPKQSQTPTGGVPAQPADDSVPAIWWSPEYRRFYVLGEGPMPALVMREPETRFMPADIVPLAPEVIDRG